MAILIKTRGKPPFFPNAMCTHKMVTKVHLTNDFPAKEAEINLKFAECMQKTCVNLKPRLHKNRSYALKCNFYWRLSYMY